MTKLNNLLCILVLLFSFSPGAGASTIVPANITSNQVWTAANSPYIVNNNILVNSGISVRVMPGVTIQTAGNFKILVNGEFIAEGTYDSVVVMDQIIFEFSNTAVGYDYDNFTGSHFRYCLFKGNSMGGYMTIKLSPISLLISNCKFWNCYYAVYGVNVYYDTVKIRIVRTIFDNDGKNGNYGSPLDISGMSEFLEMDECYLHNQYALYLTNHNKITRSTFYDCKSYSGIRINNSMKSYPGQTILKCNTFRKFRNSIIEIMSVDTNMTVDIEENTFDSSDNFIVYSTFSGLGPTKPIIKNNNFLYFVNYAIKFGGGVAGQPQTFDLQSNYWRSVDSAKIDSAIYDYIDDVTCSPLADHSNPLTDKVMACSEEFVSINLVETSLFSLYPNPAVNNFTVKFKDLGKNRVRVFSMTGELLLEVDPETEELVLDVSALANGMYIVEVISGDKQPGNLKLMINR